MLLSSDKPSVATVPHRVAYGHRHSCKHVKYDGNFNQCVKPDIAVGLFERSGNRPHYSDVEMSLTSWRCTHVCSCCFIVAVVAGLHEGVSQKKKIDIRALVYL